jgi:hypothetical protein
MVIGIVLVAGIVVAGLGIRLALARMLSTGGPPMDAIQKTVNSKDGTLIAYEQTGAGPVVILVSAAKNEVTNVGKCDCRSGRGVVFDRVSQFVSPPSMARTNPVLLTWLVGDDPLCAVEAPPSASADYAINRSYSTIGFSIYKWIVMKEEGVFREFHGSVHYDPAKPERSHIVITAQAASVQRRLPRRSMYVVLHRSCLPV